MSDIGYILREEYVQLAIDKAAPDAAAALRDIRDLVRQLDELELSFSERLRTARIAAGIDVEPLSRAANEHVSQSEDADRDFHRLLNRRCRRADTAQDIVAELIEAVKIELESTEFMLEDPPDPVCERLMQDSSDRKHQLLAQLNSFVA